MHPGGPFWTNKDEGAWSIPKGEFSDDEDALAAARREFAEETGCTPEGSFLDLGVLKQPGGKVVHAWALDSDFDPSALIPGTFEMKWPRKSGRMSPSLRLTARRGSICQPRGARYCEGRLASSIS